MQQADCTDFMRRTQDVVFVERNIFQRDFKEAMHQVVIYTSIKHQNLGKRARIQRSNCVSKPLIPFCLIHISTFGHYSLLQCNTLFENSIVSRYVNDKQQVWLGIYETSLLGLKWWNSHSATWLGFKWRSPLQSLVFVVPLHLLNLSLNTDLLPIYTRHHMST